MTKTKLKATKKTTSVLKKTKKVNNKSSKKSDFSSKLWSLRWAAVAIVAVAVIGISQLDWSNKSTSIIESQEEVASAITESGTVSINAPDTANIGEEFTVELVANSNEAINAAQVDLRYSGAIEYMGVDESASSFDVKAPIATESNRVVVPVGTTSPLQNDQVVAHVKFKAVESGEVNFSLGEETNILRAVDSEDITGDISANKTVSVSNI